MMAPTCFSIPVRLAVSSFPKILIVPVVGYTSVSSIRMVVDLPAPFCPRKPYISPSLTVKERSSTAVISLNLLEILCTLMIAGILSYISKGKTDKQVKG